MRWLTVQTLFPGLTVNGRTKSSLAVGVTGGRTVDQTDWKGCVSGGPNTPLLFLYNRVFVLNPHKCALSLR